jgi:hypothetical protein
MSEPLGVASGPGACYSWSSTSSSHMASPVAGACHPEEELGGVNGRGDGHERRNGLGTEGG